MPLLNLGACKIASDEVDLLCLISYYSLKMYHPTPKVGKGNAKWSKWHVVDLPSWLEAWNRYICITLAYDRSMALKLVKYQTIMVMLFANQSPARCLEYDSLFHQAAARDPTLRWDTIKEDIYVWAITQCQNASTSQFQLSTSTFHD